MSKEESWYLKIKEKLIRERQINKTKMSKYILVNEKDLDPEAIEEFRSEGCCEIESEEIDFIKSDIWSAINNLENYPIKMVSVKEDIAKRKSLLEKLKGVK